jgi:hypothetical protein
VQIIHRGKYKSLSAHEKRLLKRRQAIEPAIGHAKADHRMDRCWMKGALGDALRGVRGVRGMRGMPGVRLGARGLNTVKSSHEAEKLRRTPAKSG